MDDAEFVRRRHLSRGRPRKYEPQNAKSSDDSCDGEREISDKADPIENLEVLPYNPFNVGIFLQLVLHVNSYHAVMLSRVYNFQETPKDCDIDKRVYGETKNGEFYQKQDIQVSK